MKYILKMGEKGITLIALVVTIIILLILAGIGISTLTQMGLFEKTIEAKEKHIKSEMKERLVIAMSQLQTEKEGNANINDVTQDYMQKVLKEYKLEITDGIENAKKIEMSKNNITGNFIITEKLEIIEISENIDNIKISSSYEIKEYNQDKLKLLIKIEFEEGKIDSIKYPDGNVLNCGENKVEFNYDVIDGEKYNFEVSSNGIEKICTIQTKGMTKKDTVEVNSLEDFLEFRNIVNIGYNFKSKKVSLKNDLDFGKICYKVDGTAENDISWEPIGNDINQFSGTFDGEGHTINNFYSNIENSMQGLFGYVSDGKILNITIKGEIANNNSTTYGTGAISGKCKDEEFEKCINYVGMTNNSAIVTGGIVGKTVEGEVKITKCINYADIKGNQNVGGIIGAKTQGNIIIDECCNFGNIEVDYAQVGGIIGGTFAGNTEINNCYNVGNIKGTNIGNLGRIGGIIGIAYSWNGSENITISNCYNAGEISREAVYGGIIGLLYCNTFNFSNCYFENSCDNGSNTGIQSIDSITLKSYANILGEAYTNDSNNINNGYPILRWMVK